jgi:hypothetical protein
LNILVIRLNKSTNNDKEFGGAQLEIWHKAGIGDDVEFTDYEDRKIQKGKFILEHNAVKLVKVNQKMKREECKLTELNLNLNLKKINIQTRMMCFDGWNRKGLISYIGRMIGLRKS